MTHLRLVRGCSFFQKNKNIALTSREHAAARWQLQRHSRRSRPSFRPARASRSLLLLLRVPWSAPGVGLGCERACSGAHGCARSSRRETRRRAAREGVARAAGPRAWLGRGHAAQDDGTASAGGSAQLTACSPTPCSRSAAGGATGSVCVCALTAHGCCPRGARRLPPPTRPLQPHAHCGAGGCDL